MAVLISEYGIELSIVAFYVGQWHGCICVSFGTWRNWRILSDSEEKMRQTQQFWKTKKSRDWQGKSSPMVEARWTVRKGTTDSNFYGTARWTFATHSSFNFQSWTDATTTVCWPSWIRKCWGSNISQLRIHQGRRYVRLTCLHYEKYFRTCWGE